MNGMLLAAGHGTRMEPLSSWIAKPALEVLGEPLLASALASLARADCARVVINLHRHPSQVARAARGARPQRTSLRFSFEPALLGGAGGLGHARRLLGPGPVLAANADVWSKLDLGPLFAASDEDAIVLAVRPHPDPSRWASLVLSADGRVERFARAGAVTPGAWLYTGFQVVGSRVMDALPDTHAELVPVWEGLRERGRLLAVAVAGRWREAGSPKAYLRLVMDLLAGAPWVHVSATLGPGVVITGSAVGAGCRVGAAARLDGSVITAGATVGRGARVENCLIAGAVAIPDGEEVRSSLILPQLTVPLEASQ